MKNILAKLHQIMSQLNYLRDNASGDRFKYVDEEKIKTVMHPLLVKNKVLFYVSTSNPQKMELLTKNGPITTVTVDCVWHFVDVETGEEITGTMVGSGPGRDDKGLNCAITIAIKYVITSVFLIPTGDDPDQFQTEEPATPKSAPKPAPKAGGPPPMADPVPLKKTIKAAFCEYFLSQAQSAGVTGDHMPKPNRWPFVLKEIIDRSQTDIGQLRHELETPFPLMADDSSGWQACLEFCSVWPPETFIGVCEDAYLKAKAAWAKKATTKGAAA